MEDSFTMEMKQAEQDILELKTARMVASTLTSYTYTLPNTTPGQRYVVQYEAGEAPIFSEFYQSNGNVLQSRISNNRQYLFISSQVYGTLTAVSTRPIRSIVAG